MKAILALIFAAIFIYVGVNLIPGMQTPTDATPTNASAMGGLIGITLIVFTAIILFGIIKAMGSADKSENEKKHTPSKLGIYIKGHKKYFLFVGVFGFLLLSLWLLQYMP